MLPTIITDCNGKAHIVTVGQCEFYFSYQTCIAMSGYDVHGNGHKIRLANHWGPTTGKHFGKLGCKDFEIVSDEQFAAIVGASC